MKSLAAALLIGIFSAMAWAPTANADVVAYLVNVHVRPGYNFPNADAAIGYGNTYKISGTATGVDMANPMQPMNKPFEIQVTCP